MNSECLLCHFSRNIAKAQSLGDDAMATEFAHRLMKIYLDAPAGVSTPYVGPAVADLFHEMYGLDIDSYKEEKREANEFVLSRLDEIRRRVETAPDPLLAGLQYAILGNFLDYNALRGEVTLEKMAALLDTAEEMELDAKTVDHLRRDLKTGKSLLVLTDNAGEIGFDRVLAEQIQALYPHLRITFCVRGGIAANDATREDAALMGIPFPVIDNGSRIAGTQIGYLGEELQQALETTDVIISKGQANIETMLGCGYNVYYAFLLKCGRFTRMFDLPKLTPMLLRERAATGLCL